MKASKMFDKLNGKGGQSQIKPLSHNCLTSQEHKPRALKSLYRQCERKEYRKCSSWAKKGFPQVSDDLSLCFFYSEITRKLYVYPLTPGMKAAIIKAQVVHQESLLPKGYVVL